MQTNDVSDLVNALQFINQTSDCLTMSAHAWGTKQLWSPSRAARNSIVNGHTDDAYLINICSEGQATLSCSFFRNSDCDQEAWIDLGDIGMLHFYNSGYRNGYNIFQNITGSGRLQVQESIVWNFNEPNRIAVMIT